MVPCFSILCALLAAVQGTGQNAWQRMEGKAGFLLPVGAWLKNIKVRDVVLVIYSERKLYPGTVHLLPFIKIYSKMPAFP